MSFRSLSESLQETLAVFDEVGTPLTTTEVAEQLDLERRTAYARLERLVEDEHLKTKKAGASGRVWWRVPATVDGSDSTVGSEPSLDQILAGVEVGLFVLDEDFEVAHVNEATERYFGIDGEAVVGRDKRTLVDERIKDVVAESETFAETVLATYEDNTYVERFECHVRTGEDRTERWLEHRSKPIDAGEYAGGRIEVYYDITERKRAQQRRQEERAEFQSLVDAVEEYAIFTLDDEGCVRTWNAGAERIKGYDAADIVGEHISTFYTSDAVEAGVPSANLAEAARDGSVEDEGWRVRADGSRFWATVTLSAIRNDDGDVTGYAKVTRDMTDRREYEQQLRDEKSFVESILDNQQDLVYAIDTTGEFLRWSDSVREVTGYTDDELTSMRPMDLLADRAVEEATAAIERVINDGERLDMEFPLVTKSGEEIPYEFTGGPITGDGEVVGLAGVGRDISERKARERRLERQRDELEAELDDVFGRIDDAMVGLDENWEFTYSNRQAEELLGFEDEGLVGKNIWETFPAEAERSYRDHYEQALSSGESVTFEEYTETADAWLEVSAYPSESGLSVYFKDITERKERERELEQYERTMETIADGVYVLDESGCFQQVNDAFVAMTDYCRGELLGSHASMVFGADFEELDRAADRAFATGETDVAVFEEEILTSAGETITVESRFTPLRVADGEGRVGVVRDITDRKEHEQELERYETIIETVGDGIYTVDTDGRFTLVNEAYAEMTGYEREELLGADVSLVASRETIDAASDLEAQLADGADSVVSLEADIERKDGSTVAAEARFSLVDDGTGEYERVGVVRDITERRERERELEEARRRYQTLIENFPNGAVGLVNHDLQYITFGGTVEGDIHVPRAEIEGGSLHEVLPDAVADVVDSGYTDALAGNPSTFESTIDGNTYQFHFVPVRDDDGEVFAAMGISQDITDRKEYERYLEDAKSRLEAATDAGAIGTWELSIPENEVVAGPSFAKMFGVDPDAAREGASLEQYLSAIHEEDRGRVETAVEEAIENCSEFEEEYRVRNADRDFRWVVARGHVECDEDGQPVTFPGALTDITERKEAELELERQRQQLAALNNLSWVVQDITSAVIERSTREEIERTVCERLAASDSYEFAWICEVDASTGSLTPRVESGVDGYLDDISLSVDEDDATGRGPAGRAVRTGEMQVASAFEDPEFEPWREAAQEYGFRSSAAIPIVHEGTLYGVLGVYANRPRAFDGEEGAVIGQLGEIVGHAIGAAERKQALLSDEMVEVEFQIPDVFASVGVTADTEGTITLDAPVSVGDGEYLVYGTATPDALDSLERLVDAVPYWESVTVRSEGDPTSFELRLTDPPVLSAVAERGGYIDGAAIEDGDYRMTVHLAPTTDVRAVIDTVTDAYPDAEMLSRRQLVRDREDPQQAMRQLLSDLTDRQRTALETAYRSGFFEWPRDTSGEELAESLGVAPPTFHQHLRKAERKVFAAVHQSTGTNDE